MLRSNSLRIAMALLLATWSPLWCHCVLLAAATVRSAHAGEFQTVAASVIHADHALDECCADDDASLPAMVVACCSDKSDDGRSVGCSGDCACCDRAGGAAPSNLSGNDLVELRLCAFAAIPIDSAMRIMTRGVQDLLEAAPRGPA